MSTVSVALYEVMIYRKNKSSKDLELLGDFDNGSDLISLFQKLPSLLNDGTKSVTLIDDAIKNRRLRINTDEFKPFGRVIEGELETGDYGVESPLIDGTGATVGKLKKEHSAMKPFYFLCELQKNSPKGILILQRFRQFGVFSMFAEAIRKQFAKEHPNYTIRFKPLVSKGEFNRIFQDGVIKKISFSSNNKAQFQNALKVKTLDGSFDYEDAYLEVNLVAKREKGLNLKNPFKALLNGNSQPGDFFSFSDFDYSKLKVVMNIGNKPYTIDFSNWEQFSPDIDITSKVKLDPVSGFPVIDDVRQACLEVLDDIKKENNYA